MWLSSPVAESTLPTTARLRLPATLLHSQVPLSRLMLTSSVAHRRIFASGMRLLRSLLFRHRGRNIPSLIGRDDLLRVGSSVRIRQPRSALTGFELKCDRHLIRIDSYIQQITIETESVIQRFSY